MSVYFMEAGDKAAIKIGVSKNNIKARLRDIQHANHLPIKLLRIIPGDFRHEAWLHSYFSNCKLRSRGEWFSFVPEMLTIVPKLSPSEKKRNENMTLREYREAKGLTLAAMAAELGCSISTLSRIECGLRRPKYALTQAIVSATNNKVRARDLHPEAA